MEGFQRKYLRGLAHGLKPVVFIGHKGTTAAVLRSIDEALASHELIKIKFIELKDKEKKGELVKIMTSKLRCEMVGSIGHTVILYRKNEDPEKQQIHLPERS